MVKHYLRLLEILLIGIQHVHSAVAALKAKNSLRMRRNFVLILFENPAADLAEAY